MLERDFGIKFNKSHISQVCNKLRKNTKDIFLNINNHRKRLSERTSRTDDAIV